QRHRKVIKHLGQSQSSAIDREALTGQRIEKPSSGLGRREHPGLIAPVALTEGKLFDAAAGQQAGDDRERDGPRCDSTEGEDVFGERPLAFHWPVLALTEEGRVSVATREGLTDQVELDPTIAFPVYKVSGEGRLIRGGFQRLGH